MQTNREDAEKVSLSFSSAFIPFPPRTYQLPDYEYVARPIRPSMTSPSARAVPNALFLSVFLSKASFLPTYVHHLKKIVFHDVKIDVFFNGELCASAYVSGRFHSDTYEATQQIIRFSGRRVHRLLEKPWILVPSGHHADGRSRPERHNMESSGDAKQRWVSVSKALLIEADRLEKGENGELSKLGDYLSALATLEMPTEVQAMQVVGDPKIGIIDVVITAGKGQKDHANALRLMKPTPMRLEKPKEVNTPTVLDNVQDRSVSAGRPVQVCSPMQRMASQNVNMTSELIKSQAITEAQSPSSTLDETFTTPTKKRYSFGSTNNTHKTFSFNVPNSSTNPRSWQSNELHPEKAQKRHQSPLVNLPNASQGTFGRAPDHKLARPKPVAPVAPVAHMGNSAAPRQPPKRTARGRWEIVLDDKLTLEEEMESIAAEAARATSKRFTRPSALGHAGGAFGGERSLLRQTGNSKRRKLYVETARDNNNDDNNTI